MQASTDDEKVAFYCEHCDVFGRQSRCWLCGGPTVWRSTARERKLGGSDGDRSSA
jgi:hypothetical protein